MPHYIQAGRVPHKRHTQFRQPNGNLYAEELFSTEGFSNDYSILYHLYPPTQILSVDKPVPILPMLAVKEKLQHRSFDGFAIDPSGDYLVSRKPVLVNAHCQISLAAPQYNSSQYFFKNADADEIIFIHEGNGGLLTQYGVISFEPGDYLVIPRGTIYKLNFDGDDNRLLIIESSSPVRFPKKYLSKYGQLMEHAPFCERDIRTPHYIGPIDEEGDFLIRIKKKNCLHGVHYAHHPFDVAGWDGCAYPSALSIHDFEPITGRVHQPPPVHQTFETDHFVVCSFVPRLFDYHPNAIPAPYNHSNIDSDEVLYYVDGDFMSRKSVTKGMITLHPAGIAHGPHPGTVEKSIGVKETKELAVMIDTFQPLQPTIAALGIENAGYTKSWI